MPEHDFIATQAEILGITLSDKNFVKSLWDQHCSNITSLSQPSSDALEESGQESLEAEEEWQDRLSANDKILSILNAIRDDQELQLTTAHKEQLDWIEKQITILQRLKGDIELSLRYASFDDAARSNLAR
jgi:hypothetical protein